MKMLHLGCGKRYIPGFIHVDLCDYPHIDYRRNIGDLEFIESDGVDLIYASHVLGYFDQSEAKAVLNEWYRVIRPGGALRVSVPDFKKMIAVYQTTDNINDVLGPMYGRMEYDHNKFIYHKIIYDERSLKATLEMAGFKNIRRWDWRQTTHAQIDDYSQAYFPHLCKDDGVLISINFEAYK